MATNDTFVSVKSEFVIHRRSKPEGLIVPTSPEVIVSLESGENVSECSAPSTPVLGAIEIDSRNQENGGKSKKRPRENRPTAKDRLCSFTSKGITCPFSEECQYLHDPLEYLKTKPPDLGDTCYEYETYGFCHSGLMCRFGDSHINRLEGINLSRSLEEGGVVDHPEINELRKDVQRDLRKKCYDFESRRRYSSTPGVVMITATKSISTESPAAVSTPDVAPTSAAVSTPDVAPTSAAVSSSAFVSDSNSSLKVEVTDKDSRRFLDGSNTSYDNFVKIVDFSNKVYVAPLTTVGNLPFRRILKDFGADITCGEMAMAYNLQQGQASEWALLRRHRSEDVFGIQIAGSQPDHMARIAKILENETTTDFVDLNCGCPIDVVCSRGSGSALLNKPNKLCEIVSSMSRHLSRPLTVKIRTGWSEKDPNAHKILPMLQRVAKGKIAAVMLHGRSRLQRYHRLANWEYILQAARSQDPNLPLLPIIGNDWRDHGHMMRANVDEPLAEIGLCSCAMLGRGSLIKPWLPTEIKEMRHIDISAPERLEMLKRFCNYGFEHWGSDQQGINTTRRFLLEWLSFLHRYVPCGIVERTQKMQQRPPHYFGRCDLETLMASSNCRDWVRISELLLGPVGSEFKFEPKHKSNSYDPDSDLVANG